MEGGGLEKPIYRGGLPKKGGLGQFVDLRGVWQERGEGVFKGVDTPMPTMWYHSKVVVLDRWLSYKAPL